MNSNDVSSNDSIGPSTQPEPPIFDPASFSTAPYVRRVEKPWGYELHWVPEGLPYMGKLMHINEGECLSLQVHDTKQESYFLIAGRALLHWQDSSGEMVDTELKQGLGYRTAVGQKHRISGITDCDVIEASTPEAGTTWRLEDKYSRPNETPQQRLLERTDVDKAPNEDL
jgi:mannose-6-phosphate isomerase-like protein (cupin superfamily)